MSTSTAANIHSLLQNPAIWRGDEQARVALPSIPTGFSEFDRELPGGGWPRGVVSELLTERSGIGELSLLMPALAQLFVLDEAFNYVMNAVVLTMVSLGILNTILMRVLQRRYEFGLCSALGLRPRQLAVMVIGESLALTAFSLALGLVLGLSVQYYFATHGLDLRWFFKSSLPAALVFEPIIYSRLSVTRIASSVSIVFLAATVISLYPAFKAARTRLPGALRVS